MFCFSDGSSQLRVVKHAIEESSFYNGYDLQSKRVCVRNF